MLSPPPFSFKDCLISTWLLSWARPVIGGTAWSGDLETDKNLHNKYNERVTRGIRETVVKLAIHRKTNK